MRTRSEPVIQKLIRQLSRQTAWIVLSLPLFGESERLVRVRDLIPDLRLDIRYATENNFTKQKVYDSAECFLRPEVARRLAEVQKDLRRRGFGLMVFDCYRPLSVQRKFWAILPDERYVANPAKGSRHNRGAAVDLTLVDANGRPMEMPTDFDDFSEKAHRGSKMATRRARRNARILEEAMKRHGFAGLPTEWWHFDAEGWQRYDVMDEPVR